MSSSQQIKGKKPPPEENQGNIDKVAFALIRPQKYSYSYNDLGQKTFLIESVLGKREDFYFTNARNQKIFCSLFAPVQSTLQINTCVIYLHGNSSSRVEGVSLVKYFLPYQISVVAFDFAGCGMSEGDYISLGFFESQDLSLLVDYLRKYKNMNKFALWGRSMGAATAIIAATKKADIHHVVADSSFVSVRLLCEQLARRRVNILPQFVFNCLFYLVKKRVMKYAAFDLDQNDVLKAISQTELKPDILFLASQEDVLIPTSHSEQLYRAYDGPKQILTFPGNHNTVRPRSINEQAQEFLLNKLLSPSQLEQMRMVLQSFKLNNEKRKLSSPIHFLPQGPKFNIEMISQICPNFQEDHNSENSDPQEVQQENQQLNSN